ncbi:MAG: hypothetical protein SCAL_001052 [Candidatus Syntrophoarchaeum caldarius]|uniref:Uncharacterized protein n=1 Tax=Candidatus Syntropharchaeum caldarium TaxID=1838285 RepID=A0A1F2P8F1_9EURY|nr:MAG: hypothetical protein SCAL_001052 [Candidatus Syntrophoarchaeum caldarius]
MINTFAFNRSTIFVASLLVLILKISPKASLHHQGKNTTIPTEKMIFYSSLNLSPTDRI